MLNKIFQNINVNNEFEQSKNSINYTIYVNIQNDG